MRDLPPLAPPYKGGQFSEVGVKWVGFWVFIWKPQVIFKRKDLLCQQRRSVWS